MAHDSDKEEEIALKLKRAQENAETADRARSEFFSTMSHEVRTPMNAVLGMADLLRLTDLTRKQKNYIQIIESSGNMLLSLVDNMLDISTLELGKLVLHKQECSVNELLEQVLEIMGYQAYSKNLELIGKIEEDTQQLFSADCQRLRQIMINFVSNGIKFTNQGEIIVTIGIDTPDSGQAALCVEVSDSGIGMSDATKATLFSPFARAADADSAVHERGSGLGLAISKQLVDLMGGKIDIQSQLGEGTKACFRVPVDVIAVPDVDTTHRTRALQNRRLLVVDGNPRVACVICSYLASWCIQYETAKTSKEAAACLDIAAQNSAPFDGVVIDNDLPDGDGLSLARAIRANKNLAYLPIILLTSITKPLEIGEISSIGGVRCVNKPILPTDLRQHLFSLLEVDDWEGKHAAEESERALQILIAEDNPLNRKLLSRMLESLNHIVDCVDDGPAALRAFGRKAYDLILMDCQMPGLDGDEVTRRIRQTADRRAWQPIIVAVTADITAEHKSKCLQAGMDDFLAKPIRLQVLKAGLRRWSALIDTGSSEPADDQATMAHLLDRAGDSGNEFVRDYIDLFLRDTSMRIEVMRAATEREDKVTLGRECHALKGACLEVGVLQLGAYCDALRDAAQEEYFDNTPVALRQLEDEFIRLQPILEAEKNRLD